MHKRGCTLVVIILGMLWSAVGVAEPVVVFGSFTEKDNALEYLNRVEARIDEQVRIVETVINERRFYRVVVGIADTSDAQLRQQALNAGFKDVWSWVSPDAIIEVKASPDSLSQGEGQVVATHSSGIALASDTVRKDPYQMQNNSKLRANAETNISGYLKSYVVAQDAIANNFFATNTIYQAQNSGRLMLETFTDNTVFQLHYELSPLSVSRPIGGDLQSYISLGIIIASATLKLL